LATNRPKSRPLAATIFDVAERAGVSIKTVSRVINNQQYVSAATAKRVRNAAAELDFVPNPAARNLGGRRSFHVALWHGVLKSGISGYYTEVQNKFVSACWDNGYGADLDPLEPDSSRHADDVFAVLTAKRPSGVVLTPPFSDNDEFLTQLDTKHLAYVRVSPSDQGIEKSFVAVEERSAAHEMTEHLIELGHRRIGFITGRLDHGAAAQRTDGYVDAYRSRGIPIDENLILTGRFTFESGMEAAHRLLANPERPTAIFAANDDMAVGVIHVAHEMNLSVPGDLSVAGFDDTPIAEYIYPTLTTMQQPIGKMMHASVRYLVEDAQRPGAKPLRKTFKCSLVVRNSVAPPGQYQGQRRPG
jgi:LacI family transcriptional regulator